MKTSISRHRNVLLQYYAPVIYVVVCESELHSDKSRSCTRCSSKFYSSSDLPVDGVYCSIILQVHKTPANGPQWRPIPLKRGRGPQFPLIPPNITGL